MEQEIGVDLTVIKDKLLNNKKSLLKYAIIGFVVGVIIAFSIPKEYTSTVVFTINSNESKFGSMGGLASLVGANLSNAGGIEVLTPDIYQEVVNSTSFIRDVWKIEVEDSAKSLKTDYYDYLENYIKEPWWNYIIKSPFLLLDLLKSKDENSIKNKYSISEKELKIIKKTQESFSINTDKKTSLITFKVKTQNPDISAFMADTITSFLQEYIIQARTQKATTNFKNSEKLYLKSKEEYFEKQAELAEFIDANKNIISAKHNILKEKLQNEVNLAYAVYNQITQQLQIDEIAVQDDTPVFTVIQPPLAITKATKPKKIIILLAFIMLLASGKALWIIKDDVFSRDVAK